MSRSVGTFRTSWKVVLPRLFEESSATTQKSFSSECKHGTKSWSLHGEEIDNYQRYRPGASAVANGPVTFGARVPARCCLAKSGEGLLDRHDSVGAAHAAFFLSKIKVSAERAPHLFSDRRTTAASRNFPVLG